MESLIRPLGTDKYEVAREIITKLLQNGFISQIEFDAIDNENKKTLMLKNPA